jgi:hypothetical protein
MDLLALKRSLMPMSGPQDSGGGGGGGQPANTTSTSTNTAELPEWARGYAKDTLAKGAALTDLNQNPYQAYGGNRIAGFSNLQNQSFQGAQDMTVAPQIGQGTAAATGAGLGGLNVAGQANVGGFQNQVGGYMNPYMNQILAPQLAEANRNYDIGAVRQQQGATQAGAFGGSREAIMAAENERNRNTGLNQIYGQGLNTAYTNAQNQYNQNLQNQLAGYGLMGQSANTLGQLGQNQYQQQMGINALQNQYGGQQQAQQQRGLDTAYQDFLNQKNYPYKQLGFMSDMIRGLPLGQQSTAQVYQPPGSAIGQIAGLGVGALGLAGLGKQAGVFAEGGEVKGYADGGPMNDPYEMASSVDILSDEQLQAILQNPSSPAEFRAAQDEMAMRASEKQGVASMVPPYMSDDIVSAAGGGILAFKDEGFVKSPEKETSSIGDLFRAIGGEKAVNAIREKYYQIGERENEISAAEDVYPGIFEAMTPTERARRKAAGDRLFKGSQSVAPLSQEALAQKRDQFQKEAVANAVKYDPSTATRLSDFQPQLKTNTAGGTGGTKVGGGAGRGAGGKDDFESEMAKIKEFFKDPEAEAANKRMEEMLGKREGKANDAKQRAFYGFLANAGANIAQAASKPGKSQGIRGILQSTSEAAPASMQFANEAQKGIDALEDTNLKLNLEHQKLKIAERKNDKTAMLSAYQNIRMLKQHEATLAETVRHNQAVEGLTGQHYANTADAGIYKRSALDLRAMQLGVDEANKIFKNPNNFMQVQEYQKKGITQQMLAKQLAGKYRQDLLLGMVSAPSPVSDEG